MEGILGQATWMGDGIVAGHGHAAIELRLFDMLTVVRQPTHA